MPFHELRQSEGFLQPLANIAIEDIDVHISTKQRPFLEAISANRLCKENGTHGALDRPVTPTDFSCHRVGLRDGLQNAMRIDSALRCPGGRRIFLAAGPL